MVSDAHVCMRRPTGAMGGEREDGGTASAALTVKDPAMAQGVSVAAEEKTTTPTANGDAPAAGPSLALARDRAGPAGSAEAAPVADCRQQQQQQQQQQPPEERSELTLRSLDTEDTDDEDFDPLKKAFDTSCSSGDDDDDDEDDDDFDVSGDRTLAEREDLGDSDDASDVDDSHFDSDSNDSDDDDSGSDVSLVPEDSNILDGSMSHVADGDAVTDAEGGAGASGEDGEETDVAADEAEETDVAAEEAEETEETPLSPRPGASSFRPEGTLDSPAPRPGASSFRPEGTLDSPPPSATGLLRGIGELGSGLTQLTDTRFKLGSLGSDGEGSDTGIAKRTRANLSLVDIDLEYIEKMMPLPDDDAHGEFQLFDDEEEYENFLSAINLDFEVGDDGVQGDDEGGGDDEDDEDDEDYALVDPKAARVERRLRRVVGDLPPVKRRKKTHQASYVYRPKHERPQYRERPVYSTVRTRRARLAAERKAQLQKAMAVAAPPSSAAAVQVPPAASAGGGESEVVATAPVCLLPRGQFTPAQIGTLRKLVYEHVQLLMQTYARTAWDPNPVSQRIAKSTHGMILQLVGATRARLMYKARSKEPPHDPACFQRPVRGGEAEPTVARPAIVPSSATPAVAGASGAADVTGSGVIGGRIAHMIAERTAAAATRRDDGHGGGKVTSSPDGTDWWPKTPGTVYTVLDVPLLRMAQKFIGDVVQVGTMFPVPAGPSIPPPPFLPPPRAQDGGGVVNRTPQETEKLKQAIAADLERSFGRLSDLFRTEDDSKSESARTVDWNGGVWGSNGVVAGGGGNARGKKASRRKPPPHEMVPYFVRIPRGVVVASRAIAPVVNPDLLPRLPEVQADIGLQQTFWLPSEDRLLATGINNYGKDPDYASPRT